MEYLKYEKRGISGSSLKMVAVLTMLIDHVAAVLIVRVLITRGILSMDMNNGRRTMMLLANDSSGLLDLYQMMRSIGRIAFPIYCFLLVEGFTRTKNIYKYLLRMFLLALISEIPFNLAFSGGIFYPEYQNVMFTLFLGLLAMYFSQWVEAGTKKKRIRYALILSIWAVGMITAEGLSSDYGAKGMVCIGVLYVLRHVKEMQLLGGALSFVWELPAPLAFVFIAFYSGKKGRPMKFFFYSFYPLHLLILYWISVGI